MVHPTDPATLGSRLSTTVLVRALATELEDVVADCRALEGVIADAVSSAPQGGFQSRLQNLDLIIQRIEGCSRVLEALTDHLPSASLPTEQILGVVSLSALASRLSSQVQSAGAGQPGDTEIW